MSMEDVAGIGGLIGSKFLEYFKGVAPLAIALVLVRIFVLGGTMENGLRFAIAVLVATVGLALFVEGVKLSLIPAGAKVGEELVRIHPVFMLAVAFGLGFVATLVEPALMVTTQEIDKQSVGAISARILTAVTAVGVAGGMVLGVAKIMYGFNTYSILLPLLALLVVLCYFAGDTFSALAFDCASATTGPVNIPVNLAIAGGLAIPLGADPLKAGFGIVGFTCLGAAVAVLLYGMVAGRGL